MLEDGVDATKKTEIRGVKTARITVNEAFYLGYCWWWSSAKFLPIGKLEKGYALGCSNY